MLSRCRGLVCARMLRSLVDFGDSNTEQFAHVHTCSSAKPRALLPAYMMQALHLGTPSRKSIGLTIRDAVDCILHRMCRHILEACEAANESCESS